MNTILIMGLPGAGKTTLAKELQKQLKEIGKRAAWFNADKVREQFNDWDFSEEGRIRQANRMRMLCSGSPTDFNICDFVCPLPEMRNIMNPDVTIWVDTIDKSRFEDTNKVFVEPDTYDFRITEQAADYWAKFIIEIMNWNKA